MTSKTAIVTGASSGIGEATAARLAEAGYKVYGTSRRGAQAGQRSFEMLTLDVTSDESVAAAVGEVIAAEGQIDLLVNNAGFGVAPGAAEESSIAQARSIFETNFFGIVRMTRAVVPHMRVAGRAASSTSARCLVSCRCPSGRSTRRPNTRSKGIRSRSTTSCARRGIRVSIIEPAYTKTQFDANFLEPDSKLDAYRDVRAALSETVKAIDGWCRRAGRRSRRRAQSRQRGSPEAPVRGRWAGTSAALASQICARWLDGCRHSQRSEARRGWGCSRAKGAKSEW